MEHSQVSAAAERREEDRRRDWKRFWWFITLGTGMAAFFAGNVTVSIAGALGQPWWVLGLALAAAGVAATRTLAVGFHGLSPHDLARRGQGQLGLLAGGGLLAGLLCGLLLQSWTPGFWVLRVGALLLLGYGGFWYYHGQRVLLLLLKDHEPSVHHAERTESEAHGVQVLLAAMTVFLVAAGLGEAMLVGALPRFNVAWMMLMLLCCSQPLLFLFIAIPDGAARSWLRCVAASVFSGVLAPLASILMTYGPAPAGLMLAEAFVPVAALLAARQLWAWYAPGPPIVRLGVTVNAASMGAALPGGVIILTATGAAQLWHGVLPLWFGALTLTGLAAILLATNGRLRSLVERRPEPAAPVPAPVP